MNDDSLKEEILINVTSSEVRAALLENGVNPRRIMITGHADTQPRAENDNPENRARNRRIDITLLPTQDRHESWVGIPSASDDSAEAIESP